MIEKSTRRFRASRVRPLSVAILVLVTLAGLRLYFTSRRPATPEALAEGSYTVARVVDGDTLLLENHARVRLIGVDAPESVAPDRPVAPWGTEAAAFTREFVAGVTVRLQFDRERVDRFERFLAYVWVEDRLLNEELVRAGLARAETRFHYSETMKRRFRQAETQARAARLGIWSNP